jgi:ATP-dependent exoDNAse (exonuclease V) beta subunit
MSLDLASILTIHGFAARVLQRHAFESGASFAADISENDAHVLRETVLAASRTALAGVRNPDGHALAFVKDVYDAPDAAAVTAALDAHAAFLRTSPTEWTWVRADERDPNRELGVLTLEGRKLVAEVNSIERADHLRGLVADSKVTRHIGRTTEEAEQVLKRLGYDAPAGVVNVPRALPRRRL